MSMLGLRTSHCERHGSDSNTMYSQAGFPSGGISSAVPLIRNMRPMYQKLSEDVVIFQFGAPKDKRHGGSISDWSGWLFLVRQICGWVGFA